MSDSAGRELLPIPERAHVAITTYDAKDPDTAFPPIEPVRPPLTLVRVVGQHAKGSPDSVEASYKRRGLVQDYSLSGDFRRRYLSS